MVDFLYISGTHYKNFFPIFVFFPILAICNTTMSIAILGTQITLWCLEYGSSSFSITVGNDNSIFDLKKAILEEVNVPGNVKAKDLRLWSVNFDESQKSNSPDELLNDDNEIKTGSRKVRETFYEVQGNNIRVVVRAPDTGESQKFSQRDIA